MIRKRLWAVVVFLPLTCLVASADTLLYTDAGAWAAASHGATQVNFGNAVQAAGLGGGEYAGPINIGGITVSASQLLCQQGGGPFFFATPTSAASPGNPAGLYGSITLTENNCFDTGTLILGLTGKTALSFHASWGFIFPLDIGLFSGGNTIGTFVLPAQPVGSSLTDVSFVGFTSDLPITQVDLTLDQSKALNSFGQLYIPDLSYGSAGGNSSVPEPSSVLLLASGLLLVIRSVRHNLAYK